MWKPLPIFGTDDEGEPLAHLHVFANDEPRPLHLAGRASFRWREHGTRGHPDGTGPRRDLELAAEWVALRQEGFGWGWSFKWGTNASETTPDIGLYFGRWFVLWLHAGHVLPWSWLERQRPDGRTDYDSRKFGFRIDASHVEWSVWENEMCSSSSDPWWMRGYHTWRGLAFGRVATVSRTVDGGVCVVPMPERGYVASWERVEHRNEYQGRLGKLRDRLLGAPVHDSFTVRPGQPIPVPGKGENSWDLGDDAIYSASGHTLDDAIANLVKSALRLRRSYGGEHMNVQGGAS